MELMVSVALSLLLALALLALLTNVSRNNAEMNRTNSVIDNGRMAEQLITEDISHAGLWGGYVPTFDDLSVKGPVGTVNGPTTVTFPTALPDPCADVSTWNADYKAQLIGIPLQVYEVDANGNSSICSSILTQATAQPNSDILVVRHAAACPASGTASDADCQNTAGAMFFQLSRCPTDSASFVLSSNASDFVLKDGTCAAIAPTYRFLSTIYWVRNYFMTPGDGVPTLVRTRFQFANGVLAHQNTEALVDGIQSLRIQLGVDNVSKPATPGATGTVLTTTMFQQAVSWASTTNTYTPTNRGDGNVDSYITCNNPSQPCSDPIQAPFNLANTVEATVSVLARADGTTPGYMDSRLYLLAGSSAGPFNDGYKRHVFTQAIKLYNVAMRREVPAS